MVGISLAEVIMVGCGLKRYSKDFLKHIKDLTGYGTANIVPKKLVARYLNL